MTRPARNLPEHAPLLRLVRGARSPHASPAGRITVRVAELEDDLSLWAPKPERGKSVLVHTRISHEAEELVDFIVSRRLGEWETRNDFVRSAIYVLLALIQDASPEVFQSHQYLSAANDVARLEARSSRHETFFAQIKTAARLRRDEHGARAAKAYLRQIKTETQKIKTRSFTEAWRRFFLRDREVKKMMEAR